MARAAVAEAVLLIGIPGSGKTTFYRDPFFNSHVRLSLDLLKTRERESAILRACLSAGQSFVVDNTNVTAEERARYITAARAAGFRVIGYFFQANVRRSIALNKKREAAKAVPVYGVLRAYKRLVPPDSAEGFDQLFLVDFGKDNDFVVISGMQRIQESG
jgi:predicted kinase